MTKPRLSAQEAVHAVLSLTKFRTGTRRRIRNSLIICKKSILTYAI